MDPAETETALRMNTKKLEGPAKSGAIALSGIAAEIERQPPGTIQCYVSHQSECTYVALACNRPYTVDVWEARGSMEERELAVGAILSGLQIAYDKHMEAGECE